MVTRADIENNLFQFYSEFGKTEVSAKYLKYGIQYTALPDNAWPSFVLGGSEIYPQLIEEIASEMESGNLPPWWIKSIDNQKQFDDLAWNYQIRKVAEWTGMKLELPQPFKLKIPAGELKIIEVREHEMLKLWMETVSTELLTSKTIIEESFISLLKNDSIRIFGLQRNGLIISTMLVFTHNYISGIYLVTTLREMQAKGYGEYLSASVINQYFKRGLTKFILHSTSLGLHLYQKLGFEEDGHLGVYWKVGKY